MLFYFHFLFSKYVSLLLKTKQASYAKHISEALGADTHADVSWTSSLNTPTASTLILSKQLDYFVSFSYKMLFFIDFCLFTNSTAKSNKSPCPVSVSEEQNVVVSILSNFNPPQSYKHMLQKLNKLNKTNYSQIVRKLFPSLSNASEVGFLSPQKNSTTVHQGTFILLYISLISNIVSLIAVV